MEIDGDDEQKLIQQQMEETRASLSTKLEALENQVAETVQTATDAVQTTTDAVAETVESVKDSVGEIRDRVGETVRSVAGLFDISRQAEERPWVVFGGSIGVGCLVGWYLTSRSSGPQTPALAPSFAEARRAPLPLQAPPIPSEPAQPTWMSKEIGRLRGLAIGLAMGTLRDLAKQTLPDTFSARVAEEVDKLTPQLGGEVIHGQILPDLKGDSHPAPQAKPVRSAGPGSLPAAEAESARNRAYAAV